ncbi:MAG TPA: cytochrome c oxidase subunit II [Stenotrophomonas sp.]|nr:cytochrome c oxidase subunit II [Stenotrophomonas sp.]
MSAVPKPLRCLALLAAVCTLLVLSGCRGVQSVLDPAADQAQAIDHVWWVMVSVCSVLYLAVLVALAWALLRARRRREALAEGTRHDPAWRQALVAWSILVVGLLTWFVVIAFLADQKLHAGHPDLEVRITAKQWWWQVEYLSDDPQQQFVTANELWLPRDRTARIELRSGDVIHSFWVPALTGKEDLIPGYTNALLVTPRRAGAYRGQCGEFCGLQHAHMALDVHVVDDAQFAAWQQRQRLPAPVPSTALAQHGQSVFMGSACLSCHAVRGTVAGSRLGPDLTHLASRRSLAAGALPMQREALDQWLRDPQHYKPGNLMPAVPLSERDRAALADYLMGLQ